MGDITSGLATAPLGLFDPLGTVTRLSATRTPSSLQLTSLSITVVSSLAVLMAMHFQNPEWIQSPQGLPIEMVFKRGLPVFLVPYVALAATNSLIRVIFSTSGRSHRGLDALASALTLLPFQAGMLLISATDMGRRTGMEAPGFVCVYCGLLTCVLAFAINNHLGLASPRLLIFLTPVQIIGAIWLSVFLYRAIGF